VHFESHQHPWWYRPRWVAPGRRVRVRYLPGHPHHAFLDRGWRMWLPHMAFVAAWLLGLLLQGAAALG
jgi:hypothetical protein